MKKVTFLLGCLLGWSLNLTAFAQMSQSLTTGSQTWMQYIMGQGSVESVNVPFPTKQVSRTDSRGRTTTSTVVDYTPPAAAQFVGGPASGQQTLSVRKDLSTNGPESFQVLKDGRVAVGYNRAQAVNAQNQAVVAIAASSDTANRGDLLNVSTSAGGASILKVGLNGQVQANALVISALAVPANPGDACSTPGQVAFSRASGTVAGVFLGCDGLVWKRL